MRPIIFGLGNPGEEYESTRQNIGDEIVKRFHQLHGDGTWKREEKYGALRGNGEWAMQEYSALRSLVYMNESGKVLPHYAKTKKALATSIIVHDDLDLPLGTLRIAYARGDGGHNGIRSLIHSCGTDEFIRLRVGIAPQNEEGHAVKFADEKRVIAHVLGRFSPEEKVLYSQTLARAVNALESILEEGKERAMNTWNT